MLIQNSSPKTSTEYPLTHDSTLRMIVYSLNGMTLNRQSKLVQSAHMVYLEFSQTRFERYFEFGAVLKGYSLRFLLEVEKVMLDVSVFLLRCSCQFLGLKIFFAYLHWCSLTSRLFLFAFKLLSVTPAWTSYFTSLIGHFLYVLRKFLLCQHFQLLLKGLYLSP